VTIYRGHLLHITGSPTLAESADALVSEPDGALVVDARGRIAYSGSWTGVPEPLRDDTVVSTIRRR
jgi:guanine deaminase